MPKHRSKAKYNYSINRSRLKKKSNKRIVPDQLALKYWNKKKDVSANYQNLGVCKNFDNLYSDKKNGKTEYIKEIYKQKLNKTTPVCISDQLVHFCLSMMEKHDEDYHKMMLDEENVYQWSESQIRKKIIKAKQIMAMKCE
ncbi:HBV pre-S2 trans-regulated protein 3 [Intoshia linei]|uniref:Nucleolar protein 16 n=1 Tax=Intoshia linei TaxID=1819745 RepID=A0A177AXZ4_9BILA|nr:HBV pre-S2 trans-regulated protein 3 [Intoshia linei]